MLPQIYQATLVNFGNDVYIGESLHDAMDAAKKAGFEAVVPVSYTHLTLPTKRIV